MSFMVQVEGYAGIRKYNNVEELNKTLNVFLSEAKAGDKLKFTIIPVIIHRTGMKENEYLNKIIKCITKPMLYSDIVKETKMAGRTVRRWLKYINDNHLLKVEQTSKGRLYSCF